MGTSLARQARAYHRHELRTLTYVTLDQGNGGVVRDLNDKGIGVQMIAPLRPQQQLRLRFDLNQPRLRVETRAQVTWATPSGQCGIQFVDLPPKVSQQISEWIFGNLLQDASLHCEWADSDFAKSMFDGTRVQNDGLMISAAPVNVIELPIRPDPLQPVHAVREIAATGASALAEFDWIFQPLSGRGLIWTINTLVIVAALLLFALVFLSITGEPPQWPLMTAGATAVFVAALYWGFFRLFGRASPGVRLARMAGWNLEEEEASDSRFR